MTPGTSRNDGIQVNGGVLAADAVAAGPGAVARSLHVHHASPGDGRGAGPIVDVGNDRAEDLGASAPPHYRQRGDSVRALTEDEITALAVVFATPSSAVPLLRQCDFPLHRAPSWQADDAQEFWTAVSTLLDHGIVHEGRRRLLAAAHRQFPAHPVFAPPTA
ncbi:conserved hypothetical protein [Frankia canadensis]|uniref:Effector-associated domain-containing protein n=1 Tax=Frankia canadensis TaxID=1836972 RepID=A0A2I2KJF9_9ACTN|nr:effector-associated domain EAD1-containing protein [Frankia canadensis]SNQ45787.1 conserved hypothetical protein [Frankia canadensis]SOU53077.1 conserved hypothetical protein [Frankia canadensis]